MAAAERAHLTSESDLNKIYEEEAYKSRHYKKRFLLGYMQCDLNGPTRDIREEEALTYQKSSFKLIDLARFKTDPHNEYLKNSNNLFIRRSEKRKLINCDLNSDDTFNDKQYKINRIEGGLQYGTEEITDHFHSKREGANCSTADVQHYGHVSEEVPLNLAINKILPISDDINKQSSSNVKVPSTTSDEEIDPAEKNTTVLKREI